MFRALVVNPRDTFTDVTSPAACLRSRAVGGGRRVAFSLAGRPTRATCFAATVSTKCESIYIYIYVCVCVCACVMSAFSFNWQSTTLVGVCDTGENENEKHQQKDNGRVKQRDRDREN